MSHKNKNHLSGQLTQESKRERERVREGWGSLQYFPLDRFKLNIDIADYESLSSFKFNYTYLNLRDYDSLGHRRCQRERVFCCEIEESLQSQWFSLLLSLWICPLPSRYCHGFHFYFEVGEKFFYTDSTGVSQNSHCQLFLSFSKVGWRGRGSFGWVVLYLHHLPCSPACHYSFCKQTCQNKQPDDKKYRHHLLFHRWAPRSHQRLCLFHKFMAKKYSSDFPP